MLSPHFTRRHFCRIAALIESGMGELDESRREYVADRLAELFQSDNGRFQPSRFYKAAGVVAPCDRPERVWAGFVNGQAKLRVLNALSGDGRSRALGVR